MNISDKLKNLIGSAPKDLIELYKSEPIKEDSCRVNFLNFEEAYEFSKVIHGGPLGLWGLDDANDSNPYCYITDGPCKGAIIHLSHDLEPEICFSSLDSFMEAIKQIIETGGDIDELEKEVNLNFPLDETISSLSNIDSDDSVFLICTYLHVCHDLKQETKIKLTKHEDFYVREAFALWLQRDGIQADLELVETLSEDFVGQVSTPAKEAKNKIMGRC